MTALRIAVIGAGLAGISAATALREAGHQITLFEKDAHCGGRLASESTPFGDFDLGAQYFTARDSQFRHALQGWLDNGWVAEWTPRLYRHDSSGLHESADEQQRFVGVPNMSILPHRLLATVTFTDRTHIVSLHRDETEQWHLQDETGTAHGPFDRVVIALPAPQAAALADSANLLEQTAAQVAMSPTWTLAVAFDQPLPTPVEACFVRGGPIDWISRNSSKPGRQTLDGWVLHATPDWSADNLDLAPETIADQMLEAFSNILDISLPEPAFIHPHRWLHARPVEERNWGALAAPELGLYACGDWCLDGRVENAWLSGQQTARTLV